MLKISEQASKRPGAAPTVMFDAAPGAVTAGSPAREKVAFYANLFRARSDVYAVRWDSDRTGRGGWMPAVRGGFRKGVRPADRHVHPTSYSYDGDASPQSPGGMATIYRDLVTDDDRLQQVVQDVLDAQERGRHCLVLTQWTSQLERLTAELMAHGHAPVVLCGGMGVKQRTAALTQLEEPDTDQPLLVVATGPFVGEGFDCPALDTLFLAAPIAFKGRLVQYVGRILRPYPGKTTAEVHDYHDVRKGALASSLAKRASGYLSLGFPDPR